MSLLTAGQALRSALASQRDMYEGKLAALTERLQQSLAQTAKLEMAVLQMTG